MVPTSSGLSGLKMLGRYNYSAARPALRAHRHTQAMEICYLVRGRQTYRVGEDWYALRGGDVFVTFPDEVHSTGGQPEEKGVLYWMVLSFSPGSPSFLGMQTRSSEVLKSSLLKLPRRHFRGTLKMKDCLDEFTRVFHEERAPLKTCTLANYATTFLLEVISSCHASPMKSKRNPLGEVLAHIHENLGEPLRIPELARRTGLSEVRFKVRFKQETGTPPGEYIQRARIEEAKRRLATGRVSVTRVAMDLGFSSSQYFSTVFRRYTGRSPSQES
jgi:AraC-like DNA-binding protein